MVLYVSLVLFCMLWLGIKTIKIYRLKVHWQFSTKFQPSCLLKRNPYVREAHTRFRNAISVV